MATTNGQFTENPVAPSKTVNVHNELLACLKRITKAHPPVHTCSTGWSFGGLYSGPTSIAFLFYRLSQLYPDLAFEHQSLAEWAQAYLHLGARAQKPAPTPSHCGIGDEALAYLALDAVMSGNPNLVKQLCSYAEIVNSPTDDEASNEWLYGRAGFLYLLRLCRREFHKNRHPRTAALLERTVKATVDRIILAQRPWVWNRRWYLGAAHGTIGIITQVVLSMPSVASQLQPLLVAMLNCQYPSGNFPIQLPVGSDRLVQFCHGGPGFVTSLRTILPYFPEISDQITRCIGEAQADIWQRGLLNKGPSLCCGIAGNACEYFLENILPASRYYDDGFWLRLQNVIGKKPSSTSKIPTARPKRCVLYTDCERHSVIRQG